MRGFAVAALPVAIGAALQISGLTGPTLTIVAWVLVGLTTAFLVVHTIWSRRKNLRVGWASGWHRLGEDLVAFRKDRRTDSLTMTSLTWPPRRVAPWHRKRRRAEHQQLHDADTMLLFGELFGKRVHRSLRELREAGLIGEIEAETLAKPECPGAIERLGRRLIELSYKMPQAVD